MSQAELSSTMTLKDINFDSQISEPIDLEAYKNVKEIGNETDISSIDINTAVQIAYQALQYSKEKKNDESEVDNTMESNESIKDLFRINQESLIESEKRIHNERLELEKRTHEKLEKIDMERRTDEVRWREYLKESEARQSEKVNMILEAFQDTRTDLTTTIKDIDDKIEHKVERMEDSNKSTKAVVITTAIGALIGIAAMVASILMAI